MMMTMMMMRVKIQLQIDDDFHFDVLNPLPRRYYDLLKKKVKFKILYACSVCDSFDRMQSAIFFFFLSCFYHILTYLISLHWTTDERMYSIIVLVQNIIFLSLTITAHMFKVLLVFFSSSSSYVCTRN